MHLQAVFLDLSHLRRIQFVLDDFQMCCTDEICQSSTLINYSMPTFYELHTLDSFFPRVPIYDIANQNV
jgi:hypothetical protein